MTQPVTDPAAPAASQIYDRLWEEALCQFAAGEAQIDTHLLHRQADRRTGITLIARPSAEVVERIAELATELRAIEPEQYFYQPDELHVTVMSLISASESFDLNQAPIAAYQAVLGELFSQARPFTIRFRGVTASSDAVLIQGYVDDDYLNQLREAIRWRLGGAGLAGSLDTRYRIVTAHTTMMRFRARPHHLPSLVRQLRLAREREFGSALVERIDLVVNDWYMANDRVQLLACYPLQSARGPL